MNAIRFGAVTVASLALSAEVVSAQPVAVVPAPGYAPPPPAYAYPAYSPAYPAYSPGVAVAGSINLPGVSIGGVVGPGGPAVVVPPGPPAVVVAPPPVVRVGGFYGGPYYRPYGGPYYRPYYHHGRW